MTGLPRAESKFTIPKGTSQPSVGRLTILYHFHHGRESQFSLYWKGKPFVCPGIDIYSEYGHTFPVNCVSASTPCLPSWYSTQHGFWPRNIFHKRNVTNICKLCILLILPRTLSSKGKWPDITIRWPTKDTVIWHSFFPNQNTQVHYQGVKEKVASFIIILTEFLLPIT
jgi:hypothetical protein